MDVIETDLEIRKLPARVLSKLVPMIESGRGWQTLMSIIPDDSDPNTSKYTVDHINLIEKAGEQQKRNCAEILLEEWGTSGRVRPTVSDLRKALIDAELVQAADYVSGLLQEELPPRPQFGPAAPVSIPEIDSSPNTSENLSPHPDGPSLREVTIFDYQILYKGTNGFDPSKKLGEGGFGGVYLCRLKSGQKVAVKKFHSTNHWSAEKVMAEVRMLQGLSHRNILLLLGYSISKDICLVYEYMKNGSLLEILEHQPILLSWEARLKIATETAEGIEYLHNQRTNKGQPLIHRDIKSANILLDSNFSPKVGDFGLLRLGPTEDRSATMTSTIMGTSAYMAPEALRGDVSTKMDVYSFGVVLLELVSGLPPYDEKRGESGMDIVTYVNDIDDFDKLVYQTLPSHSTTIAESLYFKAKDCLQEKKKRPAISTVVNFLKDIPSS